MSLDWHFSSLSILSSESSVPRGLLKQSTKQVAEELMFAAAEGNVKKITWLIKHREIDVGFILFHVSHVLLNSYK